MRRLQRLIAASVLVVLSGAVAGCSSSISSWDPMDLLDWIDTKKKLPGERKPVFPDGVPGVEQGVPKELYKSNVEQQQQEQAAQAAAAAAAPPPEEPKPTPKHAKSKGKTKQATTEPDAAAEEEGGADAAPPAPKPKKIVRRRTTAPPPDQNAEQPAQPAQSAQSQQSPPPFPAPMPSGTLSR